MAASASARNAAASAMSSRAVRNSRRWTARIAEAQARIARRDALYVISRARCFSSRIVRASSPAATSSADRSAGTLRPLGGSGGGGPAGLGGSVRRRQVGAGGNAGVRHRHPRSVARRRRPELGVAPPQGTAPRHEEEERDIDAEQYVRQ